LDRFWDINTWDDRNPVSAENRIMNEVGNYLKKERESKSLSVEEVAERTKISARYLVCIENGDYDKLPPGPYAKGYIAAYARQVCGDETRALALFAASRTGDQGPSNIVVGDAGNGSQQSSVAAPADDTSGNNGKNGTPLADPSVGRLAFVRALRQAIPDRSNLKHLSTQDTPDRPAPGEKLKALSASLGKLVAPLTQIFKGNLVKGGLLVGMVLFGASVLILAGFGVYHLLFFETRSVAMNPSQVSTPKPPALPPTTGKAKEVPASTAASEAKAVEQTTARGVSPSPPPVSRSKTASMDAKPEKPKPKIIKPKTIKPKSLKKEAPEGAPVAPRQMATMPSGSSTLAQTAVPKTPAAQVQASAVAAAAATAGPVSERTWPPDSGPTETAEPAAVPAPMQGDGSSALAATSATAPTASVADIPLKLIKASVCTAIAERMPVGVGEHFPWTTPKIFVWSLLGATDPPAKVRHIYYHDGVMVSDVILKVGSSHWRTWSFHTLSGQLHIGPWRIDIATLDGRVLRRLHFSIE
jgi:cytoskeletal protein RodZ